MYFWIRTIEPTDVYNVEIVTPFVDANEAVILAERSLHDEFGLSKGC